MPLFERCVLQLERFTLIVTYNSRFLTWGDVWFDNEPDHTRVDCIRFMQRSRPVPGSRTKHFYNYMVDLQPSREELAARLKADTARKIRRAREQDRIVCEYRDARDIASMDEFEQMFNTFASVKGIAPLPRSRIEGLAAAGMLDFSVARDADGQVLVYHANCRDNNRVSGIYSTSLFRSFSDSACRNRISRANCLLTWTDFLHYKEQGLKSYDFGGWHLGKDPAMLSVNRFKAKFGGQIFREYQCEKIVSVRGWMMLGIAALLRGTRIFPNQSNADALPGAQVSLGY